MDVVSYLKPLHLFCEQIRIDYAKPKLYGLTPSRKKMGKAVARRSKRKIAVEALSDDQIKKRLISFIGKDIAEEVKTLSSDLSKSILRSDSTDALKEFTWDALLDELHRYAPVLSSLLFKATQTRTPRHNRDAIV